MSVCKNCGTKINEKDMYCDSCGELLYTNGEVNTEKVVHNNPLILEKEQANYETSKSVRQILAGIFGILYGVYGVDYFISRKIGKGILFAVLTTILPSICGFIGGFLSAFLGSEAILITFVVVFLILLGFMIAGIVRGVNILRMSPKDYKYYCL